MTILNLGNGISKHTWAASDPIACSDWFTTYLPATIEYHPGLLWNFISTTVGNYLFDFSSVICLHFRMLWCKSLSLCNSRESSHRHSIRRNRIWTTCNKLYLPSLWSTFSKRHWGQISSQIWRSVYLWCIYGLQYGLMGQ